MTHRASHLMSLSFVLATSLAASGCALQGAEDERVGAAHESVGFSAGDSALVLALANYPAADLALFDEVVGLDKRAAEGIIAHRRGPDGVFPSDDDDLFDGLEELDAVPYVGVSALGKLRQYAVANPPPEPELVEGVYFAGWEAEAVVWGVNQASVEELDIAVGLDARAASNLSQLAPHDTVSSMGPVGYVGSSALKKLRTYATIWFGAIQGDSLAGVFDGVYFDQPTAETALEIANTATIYQMMQGGGMYSNRAEIIAANRTFTGLGQIADISGIGSATIQALHDFASSGLWPWEGACAASVTPMSHTAVDAYFSIMDGFEPNGYDRWAMEAFEVPSCASIDDPELADMLIDALIDASLWRSRYQELPQYFSFESVHKTAAPFTFELTQSLAYAEGWRDEYLADGDPSAQATYDALVAHKATIEAIATANPDTTYTIAAHIEALECSEDAVILVDLSAGIAIVLREGPAC